ncbi:MAG: hypothetical protein JWN30_1066 [Bacilli bacterium]|nr:hypothetical protein [Bacilli bacterium]
MSQKLKVVKVILGFAFGSLFLSGCGNTNSTPTTNTSPTPSTNTTSPTPTQNQTTSGQAQSNATQQQATADLTSTTNPNIKGTATLVLNPSTNVLTVTEKVSGLDPNSSHPEHIHSGTPANPGTIVYPLNTVIADSQGNATVTTVINDVTQIPASGWIINIHLGPNLTGDQAKQIAAGSVVLK